MLGRLIRTASALAGTLLLATAALAALAPPAQADPLPPTAVAMGDSFISGEGAGAYTAVTDQNGVAQGFPGWSAPNSNPYFCHRSANASIQVASLPGITKRVNLACSGAQPADMATRVQRPPGRSHGRRPDRPAAHGRADQRHRPGPARPRAPTTASSPSAGSPPSAPAASSPTATPAGGRSGSTSSTGSPAPSSTSGRAPTPTSRRRPSSSAARAETTAAVRQVLDVLDQVDADGVHQVVLQDYTNPLPPALAEQYRTEDGRERHPRQVPRARRREVRRRLPRRPRPRSPRPTGSARTSAASSPASPSTLKAERPTADITYLNVQRAFDGARLCEVPGSPGNSLATPLRVMDGPSGVHVTSFTPYDKFDIKRVTDTCQSYYQTCQESWHPNAAGHRVLGQCLRRCGRRAPTARASPACARRRAACWSSEGAAAAGEVAGDGRPDPARGRPRARRARRRGGEHHPHRRARRAVGRGALPVLPGQVGRGRRPRRALPRGRRRRRTPTRVAEVTSVDDLDEVLRRAGAARGRRSRCSTPATTGSPRSSHPSAATRPPTRSASTSSTCSPTALRRRGRASDAGCGAARASSRSASRPCATRSRGTRPAPDREAALAELELMLRAYLDGPATVIAWPVAAVAVALAAVRPAALLGRLGRRSVDRAGAASADPEPTSEPATPSSPSTDRATPSPAGLARRPRPGDRRRAVRHLAGRIGPREATGRSYARAARLGGCGSSGWATTSRAQRVDAPAGVSWGVPSRPAARSTSSPPRPASTRPSRTSSSARTSTPSRRRRAPRTTRQASACCWRSPRQWPTGARGCRSSSSPSAPRSRAARATTTTTTARGRTSPRCGRRSARAVRGMVSLDRVGVGAACRSAPPTTADPVQRSLLAAARRAGVPTVPGPGPEEQRPLVVRPRRPARGAARLDAVRGLPRRRRRARPSCRRPSSSGPAGSSWRGSRRADRSGREPEHARRDSRSARKARGVRRAAASRAARRRRCAAGAQRRAHDVGRPRAGRVRGRTVRWSTPVRDVVGVAGGVPGVVAQAVGDVAVAEPAVALQPVGVRRRRRCRPRRRPAPRPASAGPWLGQRCPWMPQCR